MLPNHLIDGDCHTWKIIKPVDFNGLSAYSAFFFDIRHTHSTCLETTP